MKSLKCPCGSGRVAARCCKSTGLVTAGLDGLVEGVVPVPPGQLDALARAFEAAREHRPGDECPICALVKTWGAAPLPPERRGRRARLRRSPPRR